MKDLQLELGLTISAEVQITRFPDGEVRLKPKPPMVEGRTKDAARVLGVSPRTIRRMIEDGDLVAWTPYKRMLKVDMASVYEYKARRRSEAAGR